MPGASVYPRRDGIYSWNSLPNIPTLVILSPERAVPRKVRIAAKGKGKRGGGRVISFYTGPDIPVFLLNVFCQE